MFQFLKTALTFRSAGGHRERQKRFRARLGFETLESRMVLNNTMAMADDLGPQDGFRGLYDTVGASDPHDYYRFSMMADGTFQMALPGAVHGSGLRLIRDGNQNGVAELGEVLAESADWSYEAWEDEIIELPLPAGTYYLDVYAGGGDTAYHLNLSNDYPDGTFALARDLGTLVGQRIFDNDSLSLTDPSDFRRFVFSESGTLSVSVDPPLSPLDIEGLKLYRDANENRVEDPGELLVDVHQSPIAEIPLNAGTYYVNVYTRRNMDYRLSLTADYAGNTLSTARNVGALAGRQSFTDHVDGLDGDDFYRVRMVTAGTLSVAVSGEGANDDIYLTLLRDSNNNGAIDPGEQLSTRALVPARSQLEFDVAAGTYYLWADRDHGESTYQLTITADYAGETLGAARNLGGLLGTRMIQDFLSGSDRDDFYRFNVESPSNLTVVTRGLAAFSDMDLFLIRDSNDNGVLDANEVRASSVLRGNVDEVIANAPLWWAGTYFVRVTAVAGGSNYSLSLTVTPEDGAGNTLGAARVIGTLIGTQTFRDSVGSFDRLDHYGFSVGVSTIFSAALSGAAVDSNAQLNLIRDANNNGRLDAGETLASSGLVGKADSRINNVTVTAGTYFLQVIHVCGDTFYNLALTGIPTEVTMHHSNTGTSITGVWRTWRTETSNGGDSYLHDDNSGKGTKRVRYTPTLGASGRYEVYARWTSRDDAATSVPLDITHAGGTSTVFKNQRRNGGTWVLLGTWDLNAATASVSIRNDFTNGYVIAEAVRFVRV